jgi:hypothetical protein
MFRPSEGARYAIYLTHGAAVWMVAGLIHFPLFVAHPLDALLHPGKPLVVYLLLMLADGELLGSAIYLALRLADQFPGRAVVHVALPLAAAALAGAVYARFAGDPRLYPDGATLPLGPLPTRLWTAIPLSLAATLPIIIRSSRMSARRGYSELEVSREDARWRK